MRGWRICATEHPTERSEALRTKGASHPQSRRAVRRGMRRGGGFRHGARHGGAYSATARVHGVSASVLCAHTHSRSGQPLGSAVRVSRSGQPPPLHSLSGQPFGSATTSPQPFGVSRSGLTYIKPPPPYSPLKILMPALPSA